MAREQHIKVGDTLRLSAIIKGVPFPKVTWKKEEREAPAKARIDITPVGSKLEIRNAAHEDGGIYSLTVENPAGSKTVTLKFLPNTSTFTETVFEPAGFNHFLNCIV